MMKCAIVGASGYIGGELMRLLLAHPQVDLVSVTAKESAGLPVAQVHPGFSHLSMCFNALEDIRDAEVVFLALPHGYAKPFVEKFSHKTIIDTSADFRLTSCYGLPELFRADIQKASSLIASPGCFATAAILSLFPLVSENLAGTIVVNAVTGSSGSGIKPTENTLHAFREDSYFAYAPFNHRHIPEIKKALKDKTGQQVDFIFQPHSGPFIRGIHMTSVVTLKHSMSQEALKKLYQQAYANEYFIRVLDRPANIKWVKYTNFCDMNIQSDGHTAIVTTAIDNLLKGGAGQAVQSFNLMFGFKESLGLDFLSANP